MRRGEFEPRPTPDYVGAGYAEGQLRKTGRAEKNPIRELTDPDIMAHLEALVDAQRKQRQAQDALRAFDDKEAGKVIGRELKLKVAQAQWKAAEESLHAAATRASRALGLGESIGRPVEPAEIPAPPVPKIDLRKVPAPPGVRRRDSTRHEQGQMAA